MLVIRDRKFMARPIPTHTYDAVLEAIARFPSAASIEQIEERLAAPPNRRTLQRWLNGLMSQGRVSREGQGRAIKYRPANMANALAPLASLAAKASATTYAETLIPLSLQAKEVESWVR